MTRTFPLLFAVWLLLPAPRPCTATENSTPATTPATTQVGSIAQHLEDLNSDDADTRDRARYELMGMTRPQLKDLRDLIDSKRPLAPAQTAALHEIVVQVFVVNEAYPSSNDGFLGVMLEPVRQDLVFPDEMMSDPAGQLGPGVLVRECVPGFMGNRSLRAGDVVRGIAAKQLIPTPSLAELKSAIRGSRPGTILPLQVLRQGKLIDVPVTIGARPMEAVDEKSMREMTERRLQAAEEYWQATFARLVGDGLS